MEFKLPELGEGVHEGELVKWRVKEGDSVVDDQPLCEVMTDKATIEIPSPFEGTITELVAKEGDVVSVGQVMVRASAKGGAKASSSEKDKPAEKSAPAVAPAVAPAPSASKPSGSKPSGSSADVTASPSTRRFAREKSVDLGSVSASGPHGRVLRADVEAFLSGGGSNASAAGSAKRASQPVGEVTRTPIRGMRKKIAEKMRQSKNTAAHFTYVEEADATQLVKLRTQAKEIAAQQGIKLTYLPFILKAMVAALKKHPRLNSTVDDEKGEVITYPYFNVSLSVQTDDGLTVPVVKDVDNKSIFELASEIADIVDRARNKRLTPQDFQGSTITLTNAGSIGGLFATPIINYPEVAILGFNKIFKKPVVKTVKGRDKLVVRDWTYFSISLDHRIIDGAEAAEFMKTMIQYVENPALMMIQ